jgi:translation elongation factor EF-G
MHKRFCAISCLSKQSHILQLMFFILLNFFKICTFLQMSIMDTTDCVDFTSEVKNALGAFDGAVLVLSSVDGVQSQSISADNQMIRYKLPRLVFVNNLDQKGANPWEVVNQVNFHVIIDYRFCTMFSI